MQKAGGQAQHGSDPLKYGDCTWSESAVGVKSMCKSFKLMCKSCKSITGTAPTAGWLRPDVVGRQRHGAHGADRLVVRDHQVLVRHFRAQHAVVFKEDPADDLHASASMRRRVEQGKPLRLAGLLAERQLRGFVAEDEAQEVVQLAVARVQWKSCATGGGTRRSVSYQQPCIAQVRRS